MTEKLRNIIDLWNKDQNVGCDPITLDLLVEDIIEALK